jgi:hypothetical protein
MIHPVLLIQTFAHFFMELPITKLHNHDLFLIYQGFYEEIFNIFEISAHLLFAVFVNQ